MSCKLLLLKLSGAIFAQGEFDPFQLSVDSEFVFDSTRILKAVDRVGF